MQLPEDFWALSFELTNSHIFLPGAHTGRAVQYNNAIQHEKLLSRAILWRYRPFRQQLFIESTVQSVMSLINFCLRNKIHIHQMLYRVVWVSIYWGEIYNIIYNKTVQLIILNCFDAVGRMTSRFPSSAPAVCMEFAAINSSDQRLSVCFQILKLKYKLLCPRGTQTCALAVANIAHAVYLLDVAKRPIPQG